MSVLDVATGTGLVAREALKLIGPRSIVAGAGQRDPRLLIPEMAPQARTVSGGSFGRVHRRKYFH